MILNLLLESSISVHYLWEFRFIFLSPQFLALIFSSFLNINLLWVSDPSLLLNHTYPFLYLSEINVTFLSFRLLQQQSLNHFQVLQLLNLILELTLEVKHFQVLIFPNLFGILLLWFHEHLLAFSFLNLVDGPFLWALLSNDSILNFLQFAYQPSLGEYF